MTRLQRKQKLLTQVLHQSNGEILRFLQRRVGADDAPDLFGETLLTVWRRVEDLPDDLTEARMWLFGVARGTLLNHSRSEKRRLALVERIRLHLPRTAGTPAADEGSEIRDAIARLAPDLAEIVQLVHWDGFSLAEAAEIIGIRAATARARYARAKERLRLALVPAGDPAVAGGR